MSPFEVMVNNVFILEVIVDNVFIIVIFRLNLDC